jgi:tetratricopeptide (TPR) repeat protein
VKRDSRSPRRATRRRARDLAICVTLLLAACSSPKKPWEAEASPGPRPYEAISAATLDTVRTGVHEFELENYDSANRIFAAAQREAPNDLRVSIWMQEVTLALAEERSRRLTLPLTGGNSARAKLRRQYRRAAEAAPSPESYILAARLEDDQRSAELLLERALELDPDMAWAHYAWAHAAARAGDWGVVNEQLARTFELDPNHLPALRLHARAQATSGELDEAVLAYEAWLEMAHEDWLATKHVRDTAQLDLALVFLSKGEPERASELLDDLEGQNIDELRRLTAKAATLEALGRPADAREVAIAAQYLDRQALLPAVQEALLLELWLNDPWSAREAWRRVLELSGGQADLAAGLQRFRAQLHLQRLTERGMRGTL